MHCRILAHIIVVVFVSSASGQVPELINLQGRLVDTGGLVNASAVIEVELYPSSMGGGALYGETQTVAVVDGLYEFSLGASNTVPGSLSTAINNPEVWLQITVDGTPLSPREQVTSVSYALQANSITDGTALAEIADDDGAGSGLDADLIDGLNSTALIQDSFTTIATPAGTLPTAGSPTDTLTFSAGPGVAITGDSVLNSVTIGLTSTGSAGLVTADDVDAPTFSNTFWMVDGNPGTTPGTHFLGTTDNQTLELRVDGLLGLRLDPAFPPNLVGGDASNVVQPGNFGAAIGGGSDNTLLANSQLSALGGGSAHHIGPDATHVAIGGGFGNNAHSNTDYSAIGGGWRNDIITHSQYTTIAGGSDNNVSSNSSYSAIGGGKENDVGDKAIYGTIGGGWNNNLATDTDYTTIAGGRENDVQASSQYVAIAGGRDNNVATSSDYAAIGGGWRNDIGVNSDSAAIGGGNQNSVGDESLDATVAGGFNNNMANFTQYSTISGGRQNDIAFDSQSVTIGGGEDNNASTNTDFGTIAGGWRGDIGAQAGYASILGGYDNNVGIDADYAAIGGGKDNNIGDGATLSTIAGGEFNSIHEDSDRSIICGGEGNEIGTNSGICAIGGGFENRIRGDVTGSGVCTIGGGQHNAITNCSVATIGGGFINSMTHANASTISGGQRNIITTNAGFSTISGGWKNTIREESKYAMIPGGESCTVGTNALYAFAAGRRAKADNQGAFVWADSTDADFPSTTADEVAFRCNGGVRYSSGSTGVNQTVTWVPGAGSWSFTSDAAIKDLHHTADTDEVLEKLATLPLYEWSYQGYPQRHFGPTAQDFHQAFPLNDSDTTINSLDLHGVALVAIQGLIQRNTELADANKTLQQRMTVMEARIAALEK